MRRPRRDYYDESREVRLARWGIGIMLAAIVIAAAVERFL